MSEGEASQPATGRWAVLVSPLLFAAFGVAAGSVNGCLSNRYQQTRDDKINGHLEEYRREISDLRRETADLKREITRLRSR